MFGDEPCGTLLGGESQGSADENSAEHWDDIMLGGDDQDATKSSEGVESGIFQSSLDPSKFSHRYAAWLIRHGHLDSSETRERYNDL